MDQVLVNPAHIGQRALRCSIEHSRSKQFLLPGLAVHVCVLKEWGDDVIGHHLFVKNIYGCVDGSFPTDLIE